MKLTVGKRILMFFHWLLSALGCAALAAYLIKPEFMTGLVERVRGHLTNTQFFVLGIAALGVYVILAVIQICMIFSRGRHGDRGFITVDSSETGSVRIAVSAIEQMVRQSVTHIDGIHEMKIDISSQDDAINIDIAAVIVGGSHVPTITMNMQRAIRQFVEMNCGVAVRSVSITIHSVTQPTEGKGRWGRAKHDTPAAPAAPAAPVAPTYETANTVRPVEPEMREAPVPAPEAPAEPGPECEGPVEAPAAEEPPVGEPPVKEEAPGVEAPSIEAEAPAFEVRPIVLTLDPPEGFFGSGGR